MNLIAVLEGLLFLSGDDGLTIDRIKKILEINDDEINNLLNKLQEDYLNSDRGLKLNVLGSHIKITTKKEHKQFYEKLLDTEDDSLLSQASLETLAIVAYNQPLTRLTVDEIRGISSSHIIRKLVSKNLIKDLGRSELPGRPILYGTTDGFLDYFGLASIDELPEINIKQELDEEKDLFDSKYKEN